MSQIFLFTGLNSFALRREVRRWSGEFREKHGEANLSTLRAGKLTASTLFDEIAAAPFIAEYRLIILEGVPSEFSKETIAAIPEMIHPQAILLVVDPKPDQRLSATKEMVKISTAKKFPVLEQRDLLEWMRAVLQSIGSSASESALHELLSMRGEDQEALAQELDKLALYCQGRTITRDDVILLVLPTAEQVVWKLIDLVAAGTPEQAVQFCKLCFTRGTSPYDLWTRLLWMLGNLVSVTASVKEGQTNPESIGRDTGINPFTVRPLLPLARRCNLPALQALVDRIVRADIGLKTGVYRSTGEAPQELEALLDRCLMAFGDMSREP